MRKSLFAALLITVLLAGCTTGGDGTNGTNSTDGGTFTQQGVVIDSVTTSRERFRPEDTGVITAEITNMNLFDAESLDMTVSNYYPLALSSPGAGSCSGMTLSAASAAAGGGESAVCRWELTCGDPCRRESERVSRPSAVSPAVRLSYESTLEAASGSASILFASSSSYEPGDGERVTRTIQNGDIKVTMEYTDVVRADVPTVSMEMTVTNKGGGTLTPEVTLTKDGTFPSITTNSPCDSIYVPEDATEQTRTCEYEIDTGAVTPDSAYNLRLEASYKYQKTEKVNLNIVPTEG